MAHKKLKITQETDLEKLVEEGGWVRGSAKDLAEFHEAAKKSFLLRQAAHGGPRPRSGRKPLPPRARRVQMTLSVKPATAKWFRSLAKKKKLSLGAILDRFSAV